MYKSIITFIVFLIAEIASAQYQDRYWIFGRTNYDGSTGNPTNVNIDFYPQALTLYNTNAPPPGINPPPNNISNNNGFEGWAVVTNPTTGQLIFYTDGRMVYDDQHNNITPAGGLGANPSSSQPVAVCVVPVCPFNQYYIFSNPTGVDVGSVITNDAVSYRIYTVGEGFSPEVSLPGDFGDVAVGEGMQIIPSKTDPFTFWLIIPTSTGSDYVVYRIDENGITLNGSFNFGPPVQGDPSSAIMNITYRDDGSANNVNVGFTASGEPDYVFTNQFDTTNGTFLETSWSVFILCFLLSKCFVSNQFR